MDRDGERWTEMQDMERYERWRVEGRAWRESEGWRVERREREWRVDATRARVDSGGWMRTVEGDFVNVFVSGQWSIFV